MGAQTHAMQFDGGILSRGFWLYAWEVLTPEGKFVHYVGRTGDSSSPHAQSPFNRLSQHLGQNKHSNALRRHLSDANLVAEHCKFRLVAHGPIFPEGSTMTEHAFLRDRVAALEKALRDKMEASGYEMLNTVACKKPVDQALLAETLRAFAAHFPRLTATKPAASVAPPMQSTTSP